MRQRGVTIKLNPLREVVRGKRLVVVDDSIVRGTTTRQIVGLLRRAGAQRGPRPDQRAADLPPLLLRHRHPGRDRADRGDPVGGRDPRVHRRRLARLPLDRRRPRGARAAVRAVLLRLLRRQLPRARPVRRAEPQVPPRGAARPARRHGACRPGPRTAGRRRHPPRPGRMMTEARSAYRRAGVDVAAGELAVELMRGSRRVDTPRLRARRPRRLRFGGPRPAGLSRAGARERDRRRRHQDRHRERAQPLRHDRPGPRRDVRRRRRLPRRRPALLPRLHRGRPDRARRRRRARRAGSRAAASSPAASWWVARRRSTRA